MLMRALFIPLVTALATVAAFTGGPAAHQEQQAQPPQPQPPPAAQQPQQRPPTFRSGINFVRVDVIVSDKKGNPVLDLKPEEFKVSEDGTPQKIEQFDVVKIDPLAQIDGPTSGEIRSSADEEREAARPDVRMFVILLDDYHVRRGNDMAVRKPLIDVMIGCMAGGYEREMLYDLVEQGA